MPLLNDQRRAFNGHTGHEYVAIEYRNGLPSAQSRIEYRALARWRGRQFRPGGSEAHRRFGRRARYHHPAHDLDLSVRDVAREQTAVLALEVLSESGNVSRHQHPIGQGDHDLVTLTRVAHEGGAPDLDAPFARSGAAMRTGIANQRAR